MARLTDEQVLVLLKSPKNTVHIVAACMQEERLIMHTEAIQHSRDLPVNAWSQFLSNIKMLLPEKKFQRFLQVATYPLPTVTLTKAVFDELRNVYDAQDKFVKYDFTAPELVDDFLQYLGKNKDADFWEQTGFETLRKGINSILVVDLPQTQGTKYPEPYYYFLSAKYLHDIEFNDKDRHVEYIIIKQGGNRLTVMDDEFYRVYTKTDEGMGDYVQTKKIPHSTYDANGNLLEGLGYTPAESFYKPSIYGSNGVNKRGPITDELGALDYILFWDFSTRYYKVYGAWPIIVSYDEKCTYRDEETGTECDNGYIPYSLPVMQGDTQTGYVDKWKRCPSCAARELMGAGSQWTVTPPSDKNGFNPMETPVKIVSPDVTSLEWVTTEKDRIENEFYLNSVGYDGDVMNDQAVNNTQVSANFESKERVLENIKKEVQRVHKFGIDTSAKLRYGNLFIKSLIEYGNDYFLKSVEELMKLLKDAIAAGMPLYYVSSLSNKIIQTKSKNNPDQQARDAVLSQLEPYPYLSLPQVQSMGIKETDPYGYIIKLNFPTFILRFEREQTNIVAFGSKIQFKEKIKIINEILLDYAKEQFTRASVQWPNSSGNEQNSSATKVG